MLSTLTRANELQEGKDLNPTLHEECSEMLNYSVGADDLVGAIMPADLRKVLTKMDLLPFTSESVRTYKSQAKYWERIRVWTMPACFGLGVILSIIALVAVINVATVSGWWAALVIPVGVSLFVTMCILCAAASELDEITWERYTLDSYRQPVPEFALQTAVDIMKAKKAGELSEAVLFSVDCLEISRKPSRDPFLLLRYGRHAVYFLEVWNEPKFKKQRVR